VGGANPLAKGSNIGRGTAKARHETASHGPSTTELPFRIPAFGGAFTMPGAPSGVTGTLCELLCGDWARMMGYVERSELDW